MQTELLYRNFTCKHDVYKKKMTLSILVYTSFFIETCEAQMICSSHWNSSINQTNKHTHEVGHLNPRLASSTLESCNMWKSLTLPQVCSFPVVQNFHAKLMKLVSGIGAHRIGLLGKIKNAASPLSKKKRGGFQAWISARASRGHCGHPVGARERFAAQQYSCTPSTRFVCSLVHPPGARAYAKEHDHSKRKYLSIPHISSFLSSEMWSQFNKINVCSVCSSTIFRRCRIRGWDFFCIAKFQVRCI